MEDHQGAKVECGQELDPRADGGAEVTKGIVLLGPDKANEAKARSLGVEVAVDPQMMLAWDKVLILTPGTRVPWDLLPAAWHFLERWDAAAPLWRYGVTAADVGTKEERKGTAAVVRDLRVLLHSVELLFVRDNEDGRALMEAYREELKAGSERRLAFLRAYYRVKPRLCVLPTTWLAEVDQRSKQDARAHVLGPPKRDGRLVRLEVEPGRWVKCFEEDAEKVRAQFEQRRGRRK
ncbi:MAG: hypothetical protein JW900_14265 [Anaerolineae bacterium]|nr:hypothetical protein [Anaerolineae bacterium]